MKVQGSLRRLYDERRPLVEVLKRRVDEGLRADMPSRWHYESRIKELGSFSLKAETGRVPIPSEMEDFLACMIVVPNGKMIAQAFEWVRSRFAVKYRRPLNFESTVKSADSFPFDDLRLYCQRENDGSRPSESIDELIFEVQVKTFLQHAWGVATHDLTYKTADVRWGLDRIASHLRATVEFAEITIQKADDLSKSDILKLKHPKIGELVEIVGVLQSHWSNDELPENLRGMSETIQLILKDAGLTPTDLGEALSAEKAEGGGNLPTNLSPYGVIVQTLMRRRANAIVGLLKSPKSRSKIIITPEIEVPPAITLKKYPRRVIFVR